MTDLETIENALNRLRKIHELIMAKTNHAVSLYDAKCVQEMADEATCVGCGCTDSQACLDENRTPCCWLKVSRKTGMGVCSSCPTFLTPSLTGREEKGVGNE